MQAWQATEGREERGREMDWEMEWVVEMSALPTGGIKEGKWVLEP